MLHFNSLTRFAQITLIAFFASASVAETIGLPPAQPQFSMVSVERTLAINADLRVTQKNSGESRFSTVRDGQEKNTVEAANVQIGLSHALPQHMEYEIRGDGQVRLVDSFHPQQISLEAVSDVNVSASTGSWDYALQGNGAALVETRYFFDLDMESVVTLSMNSLINNRDENYTFSLARISEARPVIIWSDTTVIDEDSNVQRDFSRELKLKPGTYRMMVRLQANSRNDGTSGNAENTQATVSLEIGGAMEKSLGDSK